MSVLRYFHPVLPSPELGNQPRKVIVTGKAYVLFRDAEGRPAALDDACPHRRASLSQGRVREDGRIACPSHGWNFDAEGGGRSPASPHMMYCDTRAYQVVERFEFLWIANKDTPILQFPELGWEEFNFAGHVSVKVHAPIEVTLDNISEDEHFPFIHTTFGWNESEFARVNVETTTHSDHTAVRYSGPQRPSLWAPFGGVRVGDRFHNSWYTRFDPVHTVYTFGWTDPKCGVDTHSHQTC